MTKLKAPKRTLLKRRMVVAEIHVGTIPPDSDDGILERSQGFFVKGMKAARVTLSSVNALGESCQLVVTDPVILNRLEVGRFVEISVCGETVP